MAEHLPRAPVVIDTQLKDLFPGESILGMLAGIRVVAKVGERRQDLAHTVSSASGGYSDQHA
jgi:hypothetical protein